MASAPRPPAPALPNLTWVTINVEIIDPQTGQPSKEFPLQTTVQIGSQTRRLLSPSVADTGPLHNIYDTMYEIRKKAWVEDLTTKSLSTPTNYDNMCPHTSIRSISRPTEEPFYPEGPNNQGVLIDNFSFYNIKDQKHHLIPKGSNVTIEYGPATSKGRINRVNPSELTKWKYQVSYTQVRLIKGFDTFLYLVPAFHFSTHPVGQPQDPPEPLPSSARQSNPSGTISSRPTGSSSHASRPPSHLSRQ